MLKNERELHGSYKAIVKLLRARGGYMEAIPESEGRDDVIEGLDIQIRKIGKEIAEYLHKRKEKNDVAFRKGAYAKSVQT